VRYNIIDQPLRYGLSGAQSVQYWFVGLHSALDQGSENDRTMNWRPHRRTEIVASAPTQRCQVASIAAVALVLLSSSGCGHAFEDNGTHLSFALEKGARELRASTASELVVRYETLDKLNDSYYVEITPSIAKEQASNIWGSYLVVSGKTSGGTSYHNRFLFVPQRLYLKKDLGGSTELVLRKDGDRISVVELR
jgi:hypothetical protein